MISHVLLSIEFLFALTTFHPFNIFQRKYCFLILLWDCVISEINWEGWIDIFNPLCWKLLSICWRLHRVIQQCLIHLDITTFCILYNIWFLRLVKLLSTSLLGTFFWVLLWILEGAWAEKVWLFVLLKLSLMTLYIVINFFFVMLCGSIM